MTSNIFKGLALLALLASCSADETVGLASGHGDTAGNAVYMGNTNASGVVAVLASDETGATFSVTPRLAQQADTDITVTVEVDAETLATYNKANNLNVLPIEAGDITLSNASGQEAKGKITATIKAGDISTVVNGKLSSLSADKYPYSGRYAVPLKITKVEGPYKLLSSPQTTIVNLNRKIKTSVLHVTSTNGDHGYTMLMTAKPEYTEEMHEWTVQYIAQFNNLGNSNQTTASLRGGKGFYNRISLSQGLQAKTEGRDGDDTWTLKKPTVGEWMHVSYVYRKSGLVGHLTIYVNGEAHRSFVTSLLYPIGNEGGWGFGNNNLRDYYLREFRFWNRALTPAEIQDKYYLPEQPDAPGLEAYFPFTKETYDPETKSFRDLSGQWTFSFAPKIVSGEVNLNMEIVENVVFPAKKLQIEE
ncbi:MAG: DUF1735 domain-containing protein [Porphyromonas sp.]|nr:DUF1735 domain-containing protein [Porphyromonas sp.]